MGHGSGQWGKVLFLWIFWAVLAAGLGADAAARATSSFEGYTLFAPLNAATAYLMDNGGQIVHSWATGYRPGNAVYLLENGLLLHTGNVGNRTFSAGGAGGMVRLLDWDGNVTWEYACSGDTHLQHHDAKALPNGNILMIVWEYKTAQEAIARGRDAGSLDDGALWPDSLIEVRPTGPSTGELVWEWHAWDHLVQDRDAGKPGYGAVAEHPELIDVNFAMNGGADWTHFNAVDYNADLDQIMISVHNFNEIWIIDHSTTREQAVGHAGGASGRGGDLLYRWGNPRAYGAGTSADQRLFGQHDAEWIPSGNPGQGNLLIFNNGAGRPGGNYSSIEEITPPRDGNGYMLTAGTAFGPLAVSWQYTAKTPGDFFARNISGQQRLPNGNTLICSGPSSLFFEVTALGETVWSYDYPGAAVFKVERYPAGYEGLAGTSLGSAPAGEAIPYPIVDTGQTLFYDNARSIAAPGEDEAFYGQDAQFSGNLPGYTLSEDGLTVYDRVTGLTWTRSPDIDRDGDIDADDKLAFDEAGEFVETLNARAFGGYDDWRLPSIKALYSLMNFTGTDPMVTAGDTAGLIPFIDTAYFDFAYGDTGAGERLIDAQFWSANAYVGTVFGNQPAAFGLNLADGRIKGYPTAGARPKTNWVYFVRGNEAYGLNNFNDNGDGTVTDRATGLMWAKDDSGEGMIWEDALAWVRRKNLETYLGHDDWRLPNAKEMQSIVDYQRTPSVTGSAAIDPVFNITRIVNEDGEDDYPWFWTGTTHVRSDGSGSSGVYLCFGRALGYVRGAWLDVHGAGAQRSDPKGNAFSRYTWVANGYYFERSPQGDAVRSYNYVRPVRDAK